MKKEEVQKIRDISILKVLNLPNTGRRVSIKCPFHPDKTPSCVIFSDNSFHCFGCGAHGKGAIDFVMKLGSSFSEACNELKSYI